MLGGVKSDVIQGINETEVGKFKIVARDGRVGSFNAQLAT